MDVNRIIYNPLRRPRIPKETMNPARAECVILKMREGPLEGVKASDYLTMLEQQRECDLNKLVEDSALGSSRRACAVEDREDISVEGAPVAVARSPPVRGKRSSVQRRAATASRQQNAKAVRPRLPSPIAVEDDSGFDDMSSLLDASRCNESGHYQRPVQFSIELSPPNSTCSSSGLTSRCDDISSTTC